MIKKIDHIVITTAHLSACIAFYERLGFTMKDTGNRYQLFAGDFKINVHEMGHELSPHAKNVTSGSADLCFEISGSIEQWKQQLLANGLIIELGIVKRNGVNGNMHSIYLRDPDGNLVEFCSYE